MSEREIGINLVIVGDLAYDQTITSTESRKVIAGAVYNVAIAASTVSEEGSVGVVARVGDDFADGIDALSRRGIDTEGIAVVQGRETAIFTITQHEDNTRKLSANLGVAAEVDTSIFPESYKQVRHVHLASSHPSKYLQWIPQLRSTLPSETTISADGNDFFIDEVEPMKEALDAVDLIFINEAELAAIKSTYPDYELPKPTILKKGKEGATYIDMQEGIEYTVSAPTVDVVDTSGAGDSLAGVYLAKRLQGASIQDSLQSGVTIASKAVTDFGVEHLNPLS